MDNHHNSSSSSRERCSNPECKRINLKDCYLKMCVNCCSQSAKSSSCLAHMKIANQRKQKKESDAMFLEAAIAKENLKKLGRLAKFDHPEITFTDYNQTVVIWCLKDFLKNRKWNDDTMSSLDKKRRLDSNAMKRGRAFYQNNNNQPTTKKNKTYYQKAYKEVKRKWELIDNKTAKIFEKFK